MPRPFQCACHDLVESSVQNKRVLEQELAVLAACTQLRDLRLAGGSAHGNPICQLPALHLALAAVLPQVTAVDSAPACAIGCISGSPADAQVLAALQLKAFQTSMPVSHKHDGIPDQAPAYHKSCTTADGDCNLSQEEHGYDDDGLSVRYCSSCGAAAAPRPAPAYGAAAPAEPPRPVTAAAAQPAAFVSGYSRRRPQLVAPASPPCALCMHVGVQTTTTSNELRKLQVMLRAPGRCLASR